MPLESPAPDRDAAPPPRPRRAVFGGSFDPVHLGHLGAADAARRELGLESVVFVPCAVSPFKAGSPPRASPQQRLEMLRIALDDAGAGWASVSPAELERAGPSYSWETARDFAEADAEAEWHWILGADQWAEVDRWAEPERLRRQLRFIVVTRRGEEIRPRPGWRAVAAAFEHPASATQIRRDLEGCSRWLTPGVLRYCREQGIYPAGPRL